MVIIVFLFFGPIIYLIVSCMVDSISDKANEIKCKKYYGEEELVYFTTYNNDTITKEDIMLLFISQFKKYRQRRYNLDYKIFTGKDEQNYAWSIKATKQTFGWGSVFNIRFHFSNGWVYLSFSNTDFYSGGNISLPYYLEGRDFGTPCIESVLNTCRDEAKIMWKMNGNEPAEYSPFNYIPLSDSSRSSSSSDRTKNRKEEKSTEENKTQTDLLSFYRNLLGLKLIFSNEELKKSYREAVGKYHPDRYGTSSPRDRENAEMLMKQVNDAYETLKEIGV